MDKEQQKIVKEVLEIKKKLQQANLEDLISNFMYMPEIPMLGIDKHYVVEEYFGIKVGRIVGCEEK